MCRKYRKTEQLRNRQHKLSEVALVLAIRMYSVEFIFGLTQLMVGLDGDYFLFRVPGLSCRSRRYRN